MLSMLLGLAFLSRQIWGLVADRIGCLRTIFAGAVCQLIAMVGFLATQSEAGLFTVAAVAPCRAISSSRFWPSIERAPPRS